MKKIVLCFILFLGASRIIAQKQNEYVNLPSPNAASLGTYGKIPVNLFTGTPSIEIPLYELKEKDVSVPISLSYHSANVKGNNHPGWTGLGWSLMAGGVINREVKHLEDEHLNTSNYNAGYYFNKAELAVDNWSNLEKLKDYIIQPSRTIGAKYDRQPDIFSFNFMGYSGEFYYDHTGKWTVKSDQAIRVEFNSTTGFITDNYNLPTSIIDFNPTMLWQGTGYPRYFNEFTLITPDGSKYIFGGNNAVEYSITYNKQSGFYADKLIANSWYLTKIISPNNDIVDFEYEYRSPICSMQRVHSATEATNYTSFGSSLLTGGSSSCGSTQFSRDVPVGKLILPTYLKAIKSKNASISFYTSETNELRYPYQDIFTTTIDFLPFISDDPNNLKWYKLDSLVVKNDDVRIKKFNFSYTANKFERLKLEKVQEVSVKNGSNKDAGYNISYNTATMKSYRTDSLDHWGYMNGKSPFTSNYTTILSFVQSYYPFREVDASGNFQKGELINKITYPTGGYSTFVFEPNTHSKTVNEYRVLSAQHTNQITGGLRVAKINHYTDANTTTPSVSKEYYYVKNYTPSSTPSNLVSSGILGGKVQYWWPQYVGKQFTVANNSISSGSGTDFTFSVFSSGSLFPAVTNSQGSHIGYSEVAEVEKTNNDTNGYTISTFTNFEQDIWGNTHLDEAAITYTDPGRSVFSPYSRRDIERGKVTSEKVYSKTGSLVSSKEYKYQKTAETFIRNIEVEGINYSCTNPNGIKFFGTAYKVFTYKYLLKETINKVY